MCTHIVNTVIWNIGSSSLALVGAIWFDAVPCCVGTRLLMNIRTEGPTFDREMESFLTFTHRAPGSTTWIPPNPQQNNNKALSRAVAIPMNSSGFLNLPSITDIENF
ncbi:hypothetical protein M422DRAFT_267869 [Sphaerobolus stellatus SS14]|uniref:Uncharacterized protein n=1 Tax=Sphaerobolus stellatus (strain SS14) TaxID=990650 RepID=A0A0C9U827_SPHS4|nr:hypothetical protein M422DRAFT_267869 [Sphaerobolus stellatus SS14]